MAERDKHVDPKWADAPYYRRPGWRERLRPSPGESSRAHRSPGARPRSGRSLLQSAIISAGLLWFAGAMAVQIPASLANPYPLPTSIADVVERRLPADRAWVTVKGTLREPTETVGGFHQPTLHLYILVDPVDRQHAIVLRSDQWPAQPGSEVTVSGRVNGMGSDWAEWARANTGPMILATDVYLDNHAGEYPPPVLVAIALALTLGGLVYFVRSLRRFLFWP